MSKSKTANSKTTVDKGSKVASDLELYSQANSTVSSVTQSVLGYGTDSDHLQNCDANLLKALRKSFLIGLERVEITMKKRSLL
jgi:hypothetical protein